MEKYIYRDLKYKNVFFTLFNMIVEFNNFKKFTHQDAEFFLFI